MRLHGKASPSPFSHTGAQLTSRIVVVYSILPRPLFLRRTSLEAEVEPGGSEHRDGWDSSAPVETFVSWTCQVFRAKVGREGGDYIHETV